MTNRFFLDYTVSRWETETNMAFLAGDEARHFRKVMRGKEGDTLFLFDGTGSCFQGIAESIHKGGVWIRITETFTGDIESPLRLTVAAALPKGDRQRFLIEKLAELGVTRFIPVQMERSVARANEPVIQRFQRYVIESAKQCGRNVLMEILNEIPLGKLNDILSSEDNVKFILHPVALGAVGQTTVRQYLMNTPKIQRAVFLAGPEGSFTEQEVELVLQKGFVPLDLGKRILRTETACIAAAAAFLTFAD